MGTLIGLPMPQPGETITEGLVVRWMKKEGEEVVEKEAVVELETAKAVFEYESPLAGKLVKILTQEGEEQKVGGALALLECEEAAAKKYLRLGVGVEVDASGQPIIKAAKIGATAGAAAAAGSGEAVAVAASGGAGGAVAKAAGEKQIFAPFIRTLAKEHGISEGQLANIPGTGIAGRLTKRDLLTYIESRPAASATSSAMLPPPISGSTRVEPKPLRRRIAGNMVLAKSTIPHAGTAVEVDMTALLGLRDKGKAQFEKRHQAKLRLTPFFLFAVREALKKYPACNNFYFIDEGGKHWIEEHDFINLGIAVGTERGLMVPVIKQSQNMGFVDLAKASDILVEKAGAGKLSPDELTEATITINNPGALGSIRGNQIIAYPQAMIIGIHTIKEQACFVAGKCVPRHKMELDCSFDHRMIDGVEAVGMLSACKAVLENPREYFKELK